MSNLNLRLLTALMHVVALASAAALTNTGLNCSKSSIPTPYLPGAVIRSLTAEPVANLTILVPQNGAGPYFDTSYSGLDFCNVTIVYQYNTTNNDLAIKTTIWLPTHNWNGRFQGTGGSGFVAGLGALGLAPAVAKGYAAAETNSGHSEILQGLHGWALTNASKVDLPRLTSFASTSLNDLAVLGKAVTQSFYGTKARYSYWNGCSTGGRQGLMLAQRYPDAFDGIAALSPAINWPSLTVSTYWPQQFMNRHKHYPRQCELQHITQQAARACDASDGIRDGIISFPGKCNFDADETIGQSFECEGVNRTITPATAAVANAAWSGNGLWYGLSRGAFLGGMANTTCSNASEASCSGVPFGIVPWLPFYVEQNASFPIIDMTDDQYRGAFYRSVLQYQDVIGTADPDLSSFQAAGGKMITTHGLDDPAIFPNGTVQYYQSVLFSDDHAQDYYRFFQAPGIGHCSSPETASFYPHDTMEALVRWVEHGEAPESLTGVNQSNSDLLRPLCPYPKEQHYLGGDVKSAQSFGCK